MTTLSFSNISKINSAYRAVWQAPSNIALVKYWGKKATQQPVNSSLSMALSKASTKTSVEITPAYHRSISFSFEEKQKPEFVPKIEQFFSRIEEYCPWIKYASFTIKSKNTFPHSAGIASSASSMAALALAITDIDQQLLPEKGSEDFLIKASFLARLASGSASRSVYGGYSVWGLHPHFSGSSDSFAIAYKKIHPVFETYHDDVLITDSKPKSVSSTAGHELMGNHPFRDGRIAQAEKNIRELAKALEQGNLESFIEITENEALTLHGLMMSSEESFTLMKPKTLAIIEAVRNFRKQSDVPLCFTLDAGPNVHLLYPDKVKEKVQQFIKGELLQYCENQFYLEDITGKGPKKIRTL